MPVISVTLVPCKRYLTRNGSCSASASRILGSSAFSSRGSTAPRSGTLDGPPLLHHHSWSASTMVDRHSATSVQTGIRELFRGDVRVNPYTAGSAPPPNARKWSSALLQHAAHVLEQSHAGFVVLGLVQDAAQLQREGRELIVPIPALPGFLRARGG